MSDNIEMLWNCSACKQVNGGLIKKCKSCGKALDHEQWYMPKDLNNKLTNSEDIRKAEAGPDWKCEYCKCSQRKGDGSCANCGGEEVNNKRVSSQNVNIETSFKNDKPSHTVIGFIVIGVAVAIIVFIVYLFIPKQIHVKVLNTEWQYTISIERNEVVSKEGWHPSGQCFDVVNKGPRFHHNNHVQVGTHSVPYIDRYVCGETCTPIPKHCYTTARSCSSNKNGTARCSGGDRVCSGGGQSCNSKYCTRTAFRIVADYADIPVFNDWYSWNVHEWRFNRKFVKTGSDFDPKKPEISVLESNERKIDNVSFTVVFVDSEGNKYNYVPGSLDQFKIFESKKEFDVKVSGGDVEIVK